MEHVSEDKRNDLKFFSTNLDSQALFEMISLLFLIRKQITARRRYRNLLTVINGTSGSQNCL